MAFWSNWFKTRAAPAPHALPRPNAAGMAMSSTSDALARVVPRDKLSYDGSEFRGVIERIEDRFAGYPADSRVRILGVLRNLAQYDEDMAGALSDLIAIANPSHSFEFVGGTRAVNQAALEVEAWQKSMYPEGGGLNGLINNQIREAYLGASSCEWYPLENRRGVQGVAIIPHEEMRVVRDPDSHAMRYYQLPLGGVQNELSPLTYSYQAFRTDGRNPYGIPVALAALEALDRKQVKLLPYETRVLKLLGTLALVTAEVPTPTPSDLGVSSQTDPLYATRLAEYHAKVADLLIAGGENGLYLGPSGVNIKTSAPAVTATGVKEIMAGNNRRVWTGLGTTSFMRGEMNSTTEALAKVVYPMLEALAQQLRETVARQIEFGVNLHLRLKGIPATAYLHFGQAPSAFALDHALANKARAEKDVLLKNLFGQVWLTHAAREWDVDLVEDLATLPPEYTDPTVTPPQSQPPMQATREARAVLSFNAGHYRRARGSPREIE